MIAGPSTDTTKVKAGPGFVLTEHATKIYPWIKDWASQFPATQEEVSGGVNAIMTNGETFIPMSGVKAAGNGSFELGTMRLRQMNNKPKEGGHAAIDKLLAMTTLRGLKPMYGGGEITPNYSGGGLTGYQNGDSVLPQNLSELMNVEEERLGAVPMSLYIRQLQGLQNPEQEILAGILGTTPKLNQSPELPRYRSEEFEPTLTGYQGGDKVSGLSKLLSMITPKGKRQRAYEEMVPQDMRNAERVYSHSPFYGDTDTLLEFENPDVKEIEAINRLVKEGDRADAFNKLLYGIVPQTLGEQGTVAKQQGGLTGYQNGEAVEGYPEGGWEEKFKSNLKNPSWEEYGMGEYATRERPGRYKDPIHKYISDMILSGRQDSLGGLIDDNYYKPLIEQELKFMNLQKRAQSAEDAIPSYSGKREGIDLGDIFGEQSWLKQRGKKKSISDYKDALGETIFGQRINELYANNLYGLDNSIRGFQGGDMVGPPVPPQMMGEQGNRELSDSIDMRQANPEVYQGGTGLGVVREQAGALQNSIKQNTVDNARKSLQLMRLRQMLQDPEMRQYINPMSLDSVINKPRDLGNVLSPMPYIPR